MTGPNSYDAERAGLKAQINVLARLVDISVTLSSTLDFQRLINYIITAAAELLEAEVASLLLYDDKQNELRFFAATGGDPAELARRYNVEGIDELVILDVTATIEGRRALADTIRRVARELFIPLTVGGGLRSIDDIRKVLRSGADKVSINTAAVQNPALVEESAGRYGSQCIVVAIDAKKSGAGWEVFTHGGRRPAGLAAVEWARRMQHLGAGEILLTSMDKDGTKDGYDIGLTRAVSGAVSIPVIASGGAGTPEHLYEGLTAGKADAVLAASIFHFREYAIREVKEYLKGRGIFVRL